jgi:uncharacterized membrane protein
LRQLLLAAHLLGFVMWLGGGLAAATVGGVLRRAQRSELAALIGIQGKLHSGLILPGCVLVVISGLVLTLKLYGSATSVNGFPVALMVMQGAGLIAAAIVLVVNVPTVGRLSRLNPIGEHAPLFDALARRAGMTGMLTGLFGFTALIAGAMLR